MTPELLEEINNLAHEIEKCNLILKNEHIYSIDTTNIAIYDIPDGLECALKNAIREYKATLEAKFKRM